MNRDDAEAVILEAGRELGRRWRRLALTTAALGVVCIGLSVALLIKVVTQ